MGLHLLHRSNGYLLVTALCAAALAGYAAMPGSAAPRGSPRGSAWRRSPSASRTCDCGIPVEITALHSALAARLVLTLGWSLREAGTAPFRG